MSSLDLSRPFVEVIIEQHQRNPKLRLEQDLKQVNTVLVSYAKALGTTIEKLSILYVCADSQNLRSDLVRHIESLDGDEKYKGQHRSRLKKLVRHLPWPREAKDTESTLPLIVEEQLPRHLRKVWFLLPRADASSYKNTSHAFRNATKDEYKQLRESLPLTLYGVRLGSALLKVSCTNNISNIRVLLEEKASLIIRTYREDNPRPSWLGLYATLRDFRRKVRAYLKYKVQKKFVVTLRLDQLQEPLQSQVRTYVERARNGFNTDGKVVMLAMKNYGLEFRRHSEVTIRGNVNALLIVLGHITHGMSVEVTDIRELLRLETREVEVDGIVVPESYNPLVEWYRDRGLNLVTERKEANYDTSIFLSFIDGVAAVSAFNGFLHLRQLFLREYRPKLDKASKEKRKEDKKRAFDRAWLDGEIQRLKIQFHNIVNNGSFKNNADGSISKKARRDLNLCLFYVALLSLRFLGVRQGSLRDCKLGENIIFVSNKCITFQWDNTKNKKGICHRLDIKKHGGTHRELIEAVWKYYKKVYPYLSGTSASDHTPVVRAERVQRVAGQFFVRCGVDGLCIPFGTESDFYQWFTSCAHLFLDFDGKPANITFNPHFLRAMFGDWLRFDLKFSKEQTAEIAADSEQVFETDYITHPNTFDATDLWTSKNKELSTLVDGGKAAFSNLSADEVLKRYERTVVEMQHTINTMAETINKLTDKNS
jgi:hypothetical protein